MNIGYVGGSIVSRLLEHPKASDISITALVRSEAKAKKLETLGVNAVIGCLSDLDKLETLASQADATFNVVSTVTSKSPDGRCLIMRIERRMRITSPRLKPSCVA